MGLPYQDSKITIESVNYNPVFDSEVYTEQQKIISSLTHNFKLLCGNILLYESHFFDDGNIPAYKP